MALTPPPLTEHVGSNAEQFNLMAVTILNLVGFANHLEKKLAEVTAELASLEVVDADPAAEKVPAKAPAAARKTSAK